MLALGRLMEEKLDMVGIKWRNLTNGHVWYRSNGTNGWKVEITGVPLVILIDGIEKLRTLDKTLGLDTS